jgi:hypothetical protein
LQRQSPHSVLLIGRRDETSDSLRTAFVEVSGTRRWAVVDQTDIGEILNSARESLAQLNSVTPALQPLRTLKEEDAPARPAMPLTSPARCLHDDGNRPYVLDSESDLWWTRDTAGHADSVFKTYRERDGVLHHAADTDDKGAIIDKWKGPIGQKISFSTLHGCARPTPHIE